MMIHQDGDERIILSDEEWINEDNVEKVMRKYLATNGYTIENPHHTKRDKGCDIKAYKKDKKLLIEVKGYPSERRIRGDNEGLEKTAGYRRNQAKGWIKKGLGQLIFYKSEPENMSYDMALALPYQDDCINWTKKIEIMLNKLECDCYFVDKNDEVITLKNIL